MMGQKTKDKKNRKYKEGKGGQDARERDRETEGKVASEQTAVSCQNSQVMKRASSVNPALLNDRGGREGGAVEERGY